MQECETNIATVKQMLRVVDRLERGNQLADAITRQDAPSSQAIVNEVMFGAVEDG